jgi:pimeloyl-ACP methyl ester carboxylesterase
VQLTREPGVGFRCRADDGVELSGSHLPSRGDYSAEPSGRPRGPAFVIGHGFTHSTDEPVTRAVIAAFNEHGGVLAADFRGHGRSGGRSSVGRDETLDLDAVVRQARGLGYGPICVVGFSMGAAVALRHAALGRSPGDAVVSVSSPSRWYVRESAPMRRLQWLLENPARRPIGRVLGVRLGDPWFDLPVSPVEAVGMITCPLLLVQGTADDYFTPAHAHLLRAAAGPSADLWIEPGMGHGESATTRLLVDRIVRWALDRMSVQGQY